MSKKGKQEIGLDRPNEATKKLINPKRGIALFYPAREKMSHDVTVGFELLFPENNLPFDLSFTVRRQSDKAQIVV